MAVIIRMPKWGLMTEGIVGAWLQEEGASISEGDPIVTIETDKAVDDVLAPADGTLVRIVASTGDELPVATPVAVLAAPDEVLSDEEIAALIAAAFTPSPERRSRASREPREARAAGERGERINASPAARKLAASLGVDLADVSGTGPGGRITSDDVERAGADVVQDPVEQQVTLADGRQINLLIAGSASAPALVMLHGLGGSLSSWQMVIAELYPDYRIVAIDLPGHGKSDKSSGNGIDHSVTGMTASIAEVLDQLQVKRPLLVGHSLGGAVAARVASNADDARGLVVLDGAGLGDSIDPRLTDIMQREPGEATARAMLELFFKDQRLVLDKGVREMAAVQTEPGAWDAQRQVAAAAFDGAAQQIYDAELLRSFDVPVLLIWGEHDQVLPLSHGVNAATLLPDAQLAVVPGIGHVPQVEAPQRVTQLIDRFVKSLSG